MSNNETAQAQGNAFDACQEGVDRVFAGIRQSVPRYHQSITNVQQEFLQALENMTASCIGMQRELAAKAGVPAGIPEAAARAARDTAEEFVRAAALQNQVVLASIDAAQQNIKTFNDNAKSFADLNRDIIASWASAFAPRAG